MRKHKRHTVTLLLIILCFFAVSPVFIQGTYASYISAQSHICRANFYIEMQESSFPESSVPESSPENLPTGEKSDIIPIIIFAGVAVLAVISAKRSEKT